MDAEEGELGGIHAIEGKESRELIHLPIFRWYQKRNGGKILSKQRLGILLKGEQPEKGWSGWVGGRQGK